MTNWLRSRRNSEKNLTVPDQSDVFRDKLIEHGFRFGFEGQCCRHQYEKRIGYSDDRNQAAVRAPKWISGPY